MKTHEIKRYPTRKMYDALEGRYVTLEDIATFVQRYEQIRVADSKTGKDITIPILLQVVGEQNGKGSSPLLTEQTLLNLVRLNGSPVVVYWSQMIENALATLTAQMHAATTTGFDPAAFNPFAAWSPRRDDKG